ncbi:MAG: hypothetical protein IPG91_22120 [Ideonella sp.]|nr:hypothetical protein [Ideonella sp.]
MATPFTRADLERSERELLRDGRWANARVEKVTLGSVEWTFKDFSSRSFLVRNTIGRFLSRRELLALQRLAGIPGVPGQAFRVDAHAIAARYLRGTLLAKLPAERVSTAFLEAFEAFLKTVHARGIVHLDTGGGSNMLMRDDGRPGMIDFQAAVFTARLPGSVRRLLEAIDLAGIYKKWAVWQPQTLGAQRREVLERMQHWRRFWVLRGYFGMKKKYRPGSHGAGS